MATYNVETHQLQILFYEVEADSPGQAEKEFRSLGTLMGDESRVYQPHKVILICPQCQGSNLTEDKRRCWDCDGGPG